MRGSDGACGAGDRSERVSVGAGPWGREGRPGLAWLLSDTVPLQRRGAGAVPAAAGGGWPHPPLHRLPQRTEERSHAGPHPGRPSRRTGVYRGDGPG